MINWQGTVISQFNQSPTLQSLLYAIDQWIDPTIDMEAFYQYIWNVDSAEGYGLDVWGRIVAVNRVLHVQFPALYWGFDEAGVFSAAPFNTDMTAPPPADQGGGVFYKDERLTDNQVLLDPEYRTLILAKALFNITNGSIPAMNQILVNLFSAKGRAYIVDNRDMSMTYVFEFKPDPVDVAIITQSGVMPKPTGVSISYAFNPISALPTHVGSLIGGRGNVRADATRIWAPSTFGGVGSVRATASVLVPVRARIDGAGEARGNAGRVLLMGTTTTFSGVGSVGANPDRTHP